MVTDDLNLTTQTSTRFVLEFRSGSFFVNVDRETGGTLDEALSFNSKRWARIWFDKFAPWVWVNGGMIRPVAAHVQATP